jgi:hypothetical protein
MPVTMMVAGITLPKDGVAEAIDAVKMCKQSGWGVMCSRRSGGAEDTTIADLAVGLCTGRSRRVPLAGPTATLSATS